MKKIQNALILFPNQLFAPDLLPKVDTVYVVEDPLFFGADQQYPAMLHKQKLVLHRATMRRYVEEALWPAGINVEYIELHDAGSTENVLHRAKTAGAEMVQIFDLTDHTMEVRIKKAIDETIEPPFELRVLPSPNFYVRRGEIQEFFANKPQHTFADFYQWQRERFNILIDKKFKPVGGAWMHEPDEQKPLPHDYVAPGFESFGDNPYVAEAKKWVEKHFANNPGSLESFVWPTSHTEATEWLKDFLRNRLVSYGLYGDAIDGQSMLVHHSGLSAALNVGLLNPQDVVDAALTYADTEDVDLSNLEPLIRRVLGWREYVRGLYVTQHISLRSGGGQIQQPLPNAFWQGTTGLPPVDDVIAKVNKNAYAHHNERLMIMGNIMLLCEVKPDAMYEWFLSLFIDSYDWMLVPNIYGISQLSDLGGMVTKPYISASTYIRSMSHYPEGEWCNVWDGLFWNYVERHRDTLAKNPRTSVLVKSLARVNPDRRRIITYRAQDFLDSL